MPDSYFEQGSISCLYFRNSDDILHMHPFSTTIIHVFPHQIVFCTYTALALWFAFIPVYMSTASPSARTLSLSFSLILNATTILGFLFIPKGKA